MSEYILKGNPVSPGIAQGRAYVYVSCAELPAERRVAPEESAREEETLRRVSDRAQAEIAALAETLRRTAPDKAEIFDAHLLIAQDEAISGDILTLIRQQHAAADWAIACVYGQYIAEFEEIDDPVIRERASDLRDVRDRLLRCCAGGSGGGLGELAEPVVLFAEDLAPSDTVLLDREKVLAIVAARGNRNSHTAILARSFGIPAVLGVPELLKRVSSGMAVIVDAGEGTVLLEPERETLARCEAKARALRESAERAVRFLHRPGETADGVRIEIDVNLNGTGEEALAAAAFADGVGLFRTEFLYMHADHEPTEEEQLSVYRRVLTAFAGKPVILRTLDIGGDKHLPYMELPAEDNPFLGLRGLRLCLRREELFRRQLRAALRASVCGQLWIMFPMVSSLEEFRRAKALVESCREELRGEGQAVAEDIRLGIMIEVPSIALLADAAAAEVDFASMGTNDLCQYVLAADRLNEGVSDCYQSYHPGLLRLIGFVAASFRSAGKPVGLCGEMGGNPLSAALLVGLGMRKLSMSASAAAGVKELLARFPLSRLEEIAHAALQLKTDADVEAYLKKTLA